MGTSCRCCGNAFLFLPTTLQVLLEWNTHQRLSGTSLRRLSGTSSQRHEGMLSKCLKSTYQQLTIGKSAQCLRLVWNETPSDESVVGCKEVSEVFLHDMVQKHCSNIWKGPNYDVLQVRLYNVSRKSKMRHPMTSRWYVSTTFLNYVAKTLFKYISTRCSSTLS